MPASLLPWTCVTSIRRPPLHLALVILTVAACGDTTEPALPDGVATNADSHGASVDRRLDVASRPPHDSPLVDTDGGLGATVADTSQGSSPEVVGDVVTLGPESWHALHQDLDEALLSVWGRGHDDLWTVGADKGAGPIVLHGSADGWTRLVTGTTGDLWWLFGPDDSEVIMVGSGGTALRYDHQADALTHLDTGTDATLFGVWGTPSESPLYEGEETGSGFALGYTKHALLN